MSLFRYGAKSVIPSLVADPVTVYRTFSMSARSPVRVNRKVPVSPPASDAVGSSACTVTSGVTLSLMLTLALVSRPIA